MTDPAVAVPEGYPQLLEQLKTQVRQARVRASRVVNTELLTLYWEQRRTNRSRDRGCTQVGTPTRWSSGPRDRASSIGVLVPLSASA